MWRTQLNDISVIKLNVSILSFIFGLCASIVRSTPHCRKLSMPSPLTLQPIAHVHQDDAAGAMTTSNKHKPPAPPAHTVASSYASSSVSLSFAFDIVTKSLNVVMTDKSSGEVVRKISFTHIPSDIHQTDKLNGLLLNQFA